MKKTTTVKWRLIMGWSAVVLCLAISGLWSVWGILENFHEGWYSPELWVNIQLMLIQYLPVALIFMLLPIITMRWHRIGLGLFLALAAFVPFFFSGASFQVVYIMLAFPLIGLGVLFFFGRPQPFRLAAGLLAGIPLLIMIVIAIPNLIRISERINDGDFGQQQLDCQGQPITWAARGEGFPERGSTWADALHACQYLSADGTQLMDTPQNIWRLPSIDEAVRCQTYRNENAGGIWNSETKTAAYRHAPDKETPLWDSYSEIIYYWTAEAVPDSSGRAYIIDYKGGIFPKPTQYSPNYLSFRCVKDVE